MPSTTNFGWTTPADTDLVKDGAAAIRTLGNGVDASFVDLKGGTTGQVLSKNSNTDLDFVWVAQDDSNAIQNAIVDAKADLITATAADTPARLAVGTDGQVLTADSTTATGLKWATSSSGGMTLINTGGTTLTGASVSITSIPSTYQYLYLEVLNYRPANDGATLRMQFNSQTGSVYIRGSGGAFGDTNLTLQVASDNGTSNGFAYSYIYGYATNNWKIIRGDSLSNNSTTPTNAEFFAAVGQTNITAAISSIQLFPDSGNFTSGTVYVYGVK